MIFHGRMVWLNEIRRKDRVLFHISDRFNYGTDCNFFGGRSYEKF